MNNISKPKKAFWTLSAASIPMAFIDFLQSVVIAISICIVIYIFIATPNQIDGESMYPTFENGEIILTNKLSVWLGNSEIGKSLSLDYQRGDIVVFQKPGNKDFIKRVIGMPGDKIRIDNGYVFINGEKLEESDYLSPSTFTRGGTFLRDDGEDIEIPQGKYAMMGDNRNNSHDSRYIDIGFIDREWIKGKVILRYLPINKFTLISSVDY